MSLLVASATAWTISSTVAQRNEVKKWFEDSGVYDNFVQEVVDATSRQSAENQDTAAIDPSVLASSAESAFTPEFLKSSLESALDSGYDWLEKDTENLELRIDFTEAKNNFASSLSQEARIKALSLPECTSIEQINKEFDVFSATCIPPGIDIDMIIADFKSELVNSPDLLPDPVIDASDIKLQTSSGEEKRIDEAHPELPKWYGYATTLPLVLTIFAIIASLAIIFLANNRRKGLGRLSKSLVLAAVSVGLFGFFSSKAPQAISGIGGADEQTSGFAENILVPFVQEAADSFAKISYIIGAIYILIAVLVLLSLFLTRNRGDNVSTKDSPLSESTENNQEAEQRDPSSAETNNRTTTVNKLGVNNSSNKDIEAVNESKNTVDKTSE